jgi:hypothetical protein
MYMLYSPRVGIIHPETDYLGMAAQVYFGFFEYLTEIEQLQGMD